MHLWRVTLCREASRSRRRAGVDGANACFRALLRVVLRRTLWPTQTKDVKEFTWSISWTQSAMRRPVEPPPRPSTPAPRRTVDHVRRDPRDASMPRLPPVRRRDGGRATFATFARPPRERPGSAARRGARRPGLPRGMLDALGPVGRRGAGRPRGRGWARGARARFERPRPAATRPRRPSRRHPPASRHPNRRPPR